MTSVYAAEEAKRNLDQSGQREDLEELLNSVIVISTAEPMGQPLPSAIELPDKDQPVLCAAIGAGATHLLTGDVQHFGPYYGERVRGVLILATGGYFSSKIV